MSGQTSTIQPGLRGWIGFLVQSVFDIPGAYRRQLAERRNRTLILTLLGLFGVAYPLLNRFYFQPFSRNVLPLPFPEDAVVTFMMIFGIMAIGLNIVAGFAGLLDLGYVAFYAFGAYTAAFFASPHFGSVSFILFSNTLPGFPGIHLPFWILVPLGMLIAATFGALLGAPTLRLRGDYLAIVTLGFGEIVPVVFKNLASVNFDLGPIHLVDANLTGGNLGINPIDAPVFFGIKFGSSSGIAAVYLGFILLLGAIAIARNLERSRMGRAWIAIREDEVAAEMMGINTVRTKLLAFGLGASFAGIGGVLQASYQGVTSSDFFQFSTSILVLIMIIVGGIGNIWGVLAGTLALVFVDKTFLPYLGQRFAAISPDLPNPSQFNFLIFGIILVVMMRFRPEGFIPSRQRAAELRHAPPGQAIGAAATMGEAALAGEEVADTLAAEQEAEVVEGQAAEADIVEIPPSAPPPDEAGRS
jgi:branched-chain amino acid transport system permease protein